jgi:hypothetical protein
MTGQTEFVAIGVMRELSAKIISIVCMATLVYGALLIDPQETHAGMSVAHAETKAIEMVPVCKGHFEGFEKWTAYYKVFAYGRGNGRAGCASAQGESEAIAKCEKALETWGVKCRVYAKSPVNGKLAIVWNGKTNINSTTATSNQTNNHEAKLPQLSDARICDGGTATDSKGAFSWDTRNSWSHYSNEAKRRGLTLESCARLTGRAYNASGQVVRENRQTNNHEAKLPQLSDARICDGGTATDSKGAFSWDTRNSWSHYSNEAKRRGLTLESCARLTGRAYNPSDQVVREEQVSDHDICIDAVHIRVTNYSTKPYQRIYNWANNQQAVSNARARGLSPEDCGRLVVTGSSVAVEKQEQQRKAEAKRKSRQAVAERERVRNAEAVKQRRLATERSRKLAKARKKILAPLKKKNKHSVAVIIGNKNYDGRTPAVDFAHNDADAMRRFVLERLAYRDGNIIDLRDAGRNKIAAVFGNERTHEGELFSIIREGKSDVIVYYSGHGVPGLKDKRPYLLPVNGNPNLAEITGYPVDTLYKNLAMLPARSVTVFLDACFSGDSDKGMLISSASGLSLEPELPSASSRLTVITAAQGNQLASWDPKARHGLFTKHLLDALNGKADDEEYGNADGKVSLSEVQTYLDDEMTYQARRTWNRRQNAYVRGSGNLVLASVFSLPEMADVASIEEMDATFTVLKTANLRAGPSTDTSIIGKLRVGSSVTVTGKVSGRNWYRLNDGSYVFGSLIGVSE